MKFVVLGGGLVGLFLETLFFFAQEKTHNFILAALPGLIVPKEQFNMKM